MDFESKQKIGIIIQKHILSTKIGYVIDLMKSNKPKCKPVETTSSGTEKIVYIEHNPDFNNPESNVTITQVSANAIDNI